jgi:methionyl-tRNA formyltransferase
MDAGPVYRQITVPLDGNESKFDLAMHLLDTGAQAIVDLLPTIESGEASPVPQDDAAATYCQLLTKADSQLDPATKDASRLEREIRAYASWPKSRVELFGQSIVVTKAHASAPQLPLPDQANAVEGTDTKIAQLTLDCADHSSLVIDELVGPSGKTMSGEAFLRGYRK